jgi:hypothetical protein
MSIWLDVASRIVRMYINDVGPIHNICFTHDGMSLPYSDDPLKDVLSCLLSILLLLQHD